MTATANGVEHMTFYQVEFWEDGQRSAHYVSSKKTAAELASVIRQSGVDEIQVARVRLDSLNKRVLLRALQAARKSGV